MRQPARHRQKHGHIARRAETRIAAEEFVRTQSRKRDFEAGLMCSPGDKKCVHAVHSGLIERADSFKQPGLRFAGGELDFVMPGTKLARERTSRDSFVELALLECQRECLDTRLPAGSKRGERGGIQSATQKDSDRNIGEQLSAYGAFQNFPHFTRS